MDLISRKAAIDALEMNGCCGMGVTYIKDCDSVPAVPLDKLCEWLAEHYGAPCQRSEIDCYPQCEPDENGECYGMRTDDKKCWHDYLSKWTEGLDAAD